MTLEYSKIQIFKEFEIFLWKKDALDCAEILLRIYIYKIYFENGLIFCIQKFLKHENLLKERLF